MSGFNFLSAVQMEGALWAHPKLRTILPAEQIQELAGTEIHDWLSALYWSEGIAAKYALKMHSLAEDKRKAAWWKVYQDEVDHQIRVGRWLLDKKSYPQEPNAAVNHADAVVQSISKTSSDAELNTAVQQSQLFFEEYTVRMLKWRLPFVVDRDLKAVLTKISRDEKFHLSLGCFESKTLGGTTPDLDCLLKENPNLLFPIHLGIRRITAEQFRQVRRIAPEIVTEVFFSTEVRIKKSELTAVSAWETLPGFNCAACCPWHESGLHLDPALNEDGDASDTFTFPTRTEGFNGIVHGGFITMALDEMLGYAVILQKGLLPLTRNIAVKFHSPVKSGQPHLVRARVVEGNGPKFICEAEILEPGTSKPKASARGEFFVPDQEQAGRLLGALADHPTVKSKLFGHENASRS